MSFMIDRILGSNNSNLDQRPVLQPLTNHFDIQLPTYKDKSGRRMWPCQVCSKPFDRPSLLARHVRTHTGKSI